METACCWKFTFISQQDRLHCLSLPSKKKHVNTSTNFKSYLPGWGVLVTVLIARILVWFCCPTLQPWTLLLSTTDVMSSVECDVAAWGQCATLTHSEVYRSILETNLHKSTKKLFKQQVNISCSSVDKLDKLTILHSEWQGEHGI